MNKIFRIVIPTTLGPSQIQYLGREDAILNRSTICLNGTSQQAGIDHEYNAFVRQPSGVVERITGHASYRMDVSMPIDAGSSWQLATLAAHIAEQQSVLEQAFQQDGASAGTLVWATGTVLSVGLAIGEVGHVAEKLRQSLPLFEEAFHASLDCQILIPEGNRSDVSAALIKQIEQFGATLHFVRSFDEVYKVLSLTPPVKAEAANRSDETVWDGNPFLGLNSYGPEHRPVFFGRARAREECLGALRKAAAQDTPFLLIHGRSGVGKSSLMRAGLAGDVERFAYEGGVWTHIDIRLSDQGDPAFAIARALADSRQLALADDGLAQTLLDDPSLFLGQTPGGDKRSSLLVTLDQFEQIYANRDKASLTRFERILTGLLETGRVWIVVTMRTDQLELLAETPTLMRLAKPERTYVLDRPSLSETTESIVQPLAAAGLRFDDEVNGRKLVTDLVEIAIASPDSLPLLQVVLTRMADMANENGAIPVEAYERLGGFEQTAARWAETVTSSLLDNTATEADLSRALSELIRIDTDTGQALSRTAAVHHDDSARSAVFDALVQARVMAVENINNAPFVRLAHEVLIEHWPRLNDLARTLRNDLQVRDWLENDAARWAKGGKNDTDLIQNTYRLAAAKQTIDKGFVTIVPAIRDFLETSIRHAEQQKKEQNLQERKDSRNRLLLGTAAALLVIISLGAWILVERNQAATQTRLAEAAEERAIDQERIATIQTALATEQTSRAQDAEQAAEQARALQKRAEFATANISRMLDLRYVEDATALLTDGQQDQALLLLHNTFGRLLDAEFLDGDDYSEEREESVIALETVLRRAAAERRYEIPADAIGFDVGSVLYYQVPSQDALWRVREDGPPVKIGPLTGHLLDAYELPPPLGAVLAVQHDSQLVFQKFEPSGEPGEVLLAIEHRNNNPKWDISMGADGVALIRERVPEETLRSDPDIEASVFLARLDEGTAQRLGAMWGRRLSSGTGGGKSFLETSRAEDLTAAQALGIEARLSRSGISLGGDYTRCLEADAVSDNASLYEEAIRSVADSANYVRCDAAGDFIAISAETNTSRGPVDRLHLVDIRAMAEGEERRTEIAKPYNSTYGISLHASSVQPFPELVHYNSRTLSLTNYADEESLTLKLPSEIETAVAMGQGRAGVIMSPPVGARSTKLLSIVDFRAQDDFGKSPLPMQAEPFQANSTIGIMHNLRDHNDPQRQNCLDLSRQIDWAAQASSLVIVSSQAGNARIPRALLHERACAKISPSGKFSALWANGTIHVLDAQDGDTIATYHTEKEPTDFVFSECCGAALLIADGNAIIHKPIPSLATFYGLDGTISETRYAGDTSDGYVFLLADGPVVDIDLSLGENRLLYTFGTAAGGLETRLHSLEPNRSWKTVGISSNVFESYFIDNNTVFYWNPSRSYIYNIPELADAQDFITAALSDHCQFKGDTAEAAACAVVED